MGAQASVQQPSKVDAACTRQVGPAKTSPSHKAMMDAQSIQRSLQLDASTSRNSGIKALQRDMASVSGEIEELYVTWRGVTPHDEPIKLLEDLQETIGNSKSLFLAFIKKHGGGREIAECMEVMQHPLTQSDKILRSAYVAKINDLQGMNETVSKTLKTLHEKYGVRCEHRQALSVHIHEVASLLDEWKEGDFKSGMHPSNEYPDGLHAWTMQKLLDRLVKKRDYIRDNAQAHWAAVCFGGLARAASAVLPLFRQVAGLP